MAATCGARFAKFILVFFNILFFCTGIVLICVGGWIVGSPDVTQPLKIVQGTFGSEFLRNAGILLITMGVFILFVTGLGIYAAISENTIALSVYMALLVVIFVGVISGGVVAIAFKDKIIDSLQSQLWKSLTSLANTSNHKYYGIETGYCISSESAHAWDYVQDTFECCGIDGGGDYSKPLFEIDMRKQCNLNISNNLPLSCCKKVNNDIQLTTNATESFGRYDCSMGYNDQGCNSGLAYFVQRYAPALIGIGLGFGFLQLFGIIFTVCLCQNPEM